jgi:glutathione S-transferase
MRQCSHRASNGAGEEVARHEAAYKLLSNLDAIVRFCCRAVGRPGAKRFGAQLADPYAEPDMAWEAEVCLCLPCHIWTLQVISALLSVAFAA